MRHQQPERATLPFVEPPALSVCSHRVCGIHLACEDRHSGEHKASEIVFSLVLSSSLLSSPALVAWSLTAA